ncbi:unnamed protein product, partial [Laminaria digitata]
RFDTERRQNQTQISRLIQDAHAVEAALRKAPGCPPEEGAEHGHNGPGNGPGGGGNTGGGGGGGGGGGFSVGGWGGGGGRGASSECNAFIELPEAGGGDSRFISAKQARGGGGRWQMRFMDYVHKREVSQRVPQAPVGLTTKLTRAGRTTGENRTRQRHSQSGGGGNGGGGGGDNHAGGRGGAAVAKPEGVRRESPLSHGTGRRRLLAEKRGILLELKGVVNRQAEALDRLVDSCGDTLGGVRSRGGVERGGIQYSQKSRGDTTTSWADRFGDAQGASYYDNNVRPKQRPAAYSPATIGPARGKGNVSFPPRPPESGTSAFLARGGRWGGGGGTRVSGRNSVASSASYATYANNKGRGRREEDAFGVCRRPAEVPTLQL